MASCANCDKVRNVAGLASPPDPLRPSAELERHLRMAIAEQMLDEEKPDGA